MNIRRVSGVLMQLRKWLLAWAFLLCAGFGVASCVMPNPANEQTNQSSPSGKGYHYTPTANENGSQPDTGGSAPKFKIPLAPGYDWEVTQSWASHCKLCNQKGYDKLYNSFYGNYCTEMSHAALCFDTCKYGWDFNLPGDADRGKPVLASGDGSVFAVGKNSWGNYVLVDHGGGVCTRYAHLLDDSVTVSAGDYVCQGLKLAEIGNTGNSGGYHLHFQFENCGSGAPLEKGFSDGNGVPVCVMGSDIYDATGKYKALKLTNKQVDECEQGPVNFSGAELGNGGWYGASCGSLPNCPLIPNCGNQANHQFSDFSSTSTRAAEAAAYLYGECALDGKNDGGLHPLEKITRAEALKIPLFLFGLMGSCGGSMPFDDVEQEDWYFPVVACGLKYGLVSTVNDYFKPNDTVSFAEAAKFVVEAASEAGMIEIQNLSEAHFDSIGEGHWAYKYVETVFYYGGMDSGAIHFSADKKLDRREYVIMVAAMSPCFCRNVGCAAGCICDQSVYACVDPEDASPGIGGGTSDGDSGWSEESDDELSDGAEGSTEVEFDLTLDCYVDVEHTRCEDPFTINYIKCSITNDGDFKVKINDLFMHLTEDAGDCQVTDPHLNVGAGTKNVDAGESKELNGHYEISCVEEPAVSEFQVSFDLTTKVSGVKTTYPGLLDAEIPVLDNPFHDCVPELCVPDCIGKACGPDFCGGFCGYCSSGQSCDYDLGQCLESDPPGENLPQDDPPGAPPGNAPGNQPPEEDPPPAVGECVNCPPNTQCVNGQCVIEQWPCDPAQGYHVVIFSEGGSFEAAGSGPVPYYADSFPPGMGMDIWFDCVDLPGAVLVHGGLSGVSIALDGEGLPPFSIWVPYFGPLVIDPPMAADTVMSGFTSGVPNLPVLIRVPAN